MFEPDANAEREFWVAAVKLLFRQIKDGQVSFAEGKVPKTMEALDAVRFDSSGDPIFETITAPVRVLANMVFGKLEDEFNKREQNSPVHDLLGTPTKIDDDVLQKCVKRSDFSRVAFDLYREGGVVLVVCSHSYTEAASDGVLSRNQAVCAGLLVRISKFMLTVVQLTSTADRGEVVLGLNRSIMESAVNLWFLVHKNEERFYEQYVKFSLAPEKELYEMIQSKIKARGGEV